jgi:hypothetical protein
MLKLLRLKNDPSSELDSPARHPNLGFIIFDSMI